MTPIVLHLFMKFFFNYEILFNWNLSKNVGKLILSLVSILYISLSLLSYPMTTTFLLLYFSTFVFYYNYNSPTDDEISFYSTSHSLRLQNANAENADRDSVTPSCLADADTIAKAFAQVS